jgi:hypothetical protein
MQGLGKRQHSVELKQIVGEASRALATLDADRLEELALSCQALNRDLSPMDGPTRDSLGRQAKEARGEMAVLSRVLEATRANVHVMNRLRELREGRLEYRPPASAEMSHGVVSERDHGDD